MRAVVVVVACRGCRAVMRYPVFAAGNIIEHYVYRFVTVGRACLVSNTAIIPLSFPSSIYIHFLLLFLYTCKENHYSDFPFRVFITRLREENY